MICFILVIENVFDPTDFDQDASLILECSSRLREQCNKFGNVKKVVVYDKHIQGICQVFFSTPEEADMGKKQSFFKKIYSPSKIGRHMWMTPKVKTYIIFPFKMLQKQVNTGEVILK